MATMNKSWVIFSSYKMESKNIPSQSVVTIGYKTMKIPQGLLTVNIVQTNSHAKQSLILTAHFSFFLSSPSISIFILINRMSIGRANPMVWKMKIITYENLLLIIVNVMIMIISWICW